MIETLYNQLRDLHARDRSETAKILKFKKKADAESDEDFKVEAEDASKKIADVNEKTKQNIQVFKDKIKYVVEECCKSCWGSQEKTQFFLTSVPITQDLA